MQFLITAIVAMILLVGVASSCPSVNVLTLQMEFMLTVPVEDWIVFQQIYLIPLIT